MGKSAQLQSSDSQTVGMPGQAKCAPSQVENTTRMWGWVCSAFHELELNFISKQKRSYKI